MGTPALLACSRRTWEGEEHPSIDVVTVSSSLSTVATRSLPATYTAPPAAGSAAEHPSSSTFPAPSRARPLATDMLMTPGPLAEIRMGIIVPVVPSVKA